MKLGAQENMLHITVQKYAKNSNLRKVRVRSYTDWINIQNFGWRTD